MDSLKPRVEELGTVAGQMIGTSPLSQISLSAEKDQLIFWLPELDARLKACGAEYCILDLQMACRKLLASGGYFLTSSGAHFQRLKRKEIAEIDPMLLPRESTDAAIDRLAEVITRHFEPGHIILIHSYAPAYYLVGNNLRVGEANPKRNQWMENLEARFREKTGCQFVDVTRFYFNQKETGRPLTDVIFEKECYEDVARRIQNILSGGDGASARPDFALSLDRYAAYYFTLQRKPQRIFLDADYFLDRLILSASDNFVNKYRAELIALDAQDWSEPEKALENLAPGNALLSVLKAFLAASTGVYDRVDADYARMFQCQVVPTELLEYLKKEYAPKAGLLPCQINKYNAGWHFAKMQGLDPTPFATEQTVAKPVVIDIFGSCVSRTAFNVQDNDFAVNRYWFHVPPYEHLNKPVDYAPDLFPEKSSWTERLVKLQFDCAINQDIRRSEGKWLILDLYSLVSPNNFYFQNCLYGDFDHRLSKQLKAQKVDIYRDPSIMGDRDELIRQMDPWLKMVSEKYGKNIIVVDCQRMDHWIGDDDKIYWTKHYTCNPFLERAAKHICKRTGAYRVSIGKNFLSDDLGFMRKTPAHKEDVCYQYTHDIVRFIVDQEPKQKHFEIYPGRIQLQRLMCLVKQNTPAALEAALPLNDLDKAVIRLDSEELTQWQDALTELYDRNDWHDNLEKLLKSSTVQPELARLLQAAARRNGDWDAAVPQNYPSYPDEIRQLAEEDANGGLLEVPRIKLKKIIPNKGEIQIKWSAPQETRVGIFRRSEGEDWKLLTESDTGKFIDKSVAARIWYQYSLCVITDHAGRRCLGGFTAPSSVRIGVGTPILMSAVRIAGENVLRWVPVEGAEGYRVYRKISLKHRWELIKIVEASSVPSFIEQFPDGAWYTVRAFRTENGKQTAGGFQPGLFSEAL